MAFGQILDAFGHWEIFMFFRAFRCREAIKVKFLRASKFPPEIGATETTIWMGSPPPGDKQRGTKRSPYLAAGRPAVHGPSFFLCLKWVGKIVKAIRFFFSITLQGKKYIYGWPNKKNDDDWKVRVGERFVSLFYLNHLWWLCSLFEDLQDVCKMFYLNQVVCSLFKLKNVWSPDLDHQWL